MIVVYGHTRVKRAMLTAMFAEEIDIAEIMQISVNRKALSVI